MNENINFRSFRKGDYEMCIEWWEWWYKSFNGKGIQRQLLPKDERCYVIEKNNIPVACIFLFLSLDMQYLAWITHLVSNPKYKEKDRKQAIEKLLIDVEDFCKSINIKYIFSIGRNKHLMNTHEKLGWHVDEKPSYEIIKNI